MQVEKFSSPRRSNWYWLIVMSVGCIVWTLYAGKDTNWDYFHYHVYAAENAWHSRVDKDYFAAGPQGLLNPYAFALFGLLNKLNLSAWKIGAGMAVCHSLNLWLIWFIIPHTLPVCISKVQVRRLQIEGVLLASFAPLVLAELGTSYTDIVTSIPVLAGVLCILRGVNVDSERYLILGGLFCGVAVGLKLSNIVVVIPVWFGSTALIFSDRRQWIRRSLLIGIGILGGFIVIASPWAWSIYKFSGNPLYPFLSEFWNPGNLPVISGRHDRFRSESILDILSLPWRMALPHRGVYVEGALPDARYLVLFLLMASSVIIGHAGIIRKSEGWRTRESYPLVVWYLPAVVVFTFMLWATISGNGRYTLPMSFLCGAAIPFFLAEAARGNKYIRLGGFTLLIGLQIMQFTFGSGLRWASVPWGDRWIEARIPQALKSSPHLYVGLELQSESWMAGMVHRGSVFTLPVGQLPIKYDGAGGESFVKLLSRHSNETLVLTRVLPSVAKTDVYEAFRRELNSRTARLGLKLLPTACHKIELQESLPMDYVIPAAQTDQVIDLDGPRVNNGRLGADGIELPDRSHLDRPLGYYLLDSFIKDPYLKWTWIYACPATLDLDVARRNQRENLEQEKIFDRIEAECPDIFRPRPGVTERDGEKTWSRFYSATDMRLVISDGNIKYRDTFRLGSWIDAGTIVQWKTGSGRIDCSRKYQRPEPISIQRGNVQ